MARKRMEEPSLKSWEEVNLTMKKLLEAEIEVEKVDADMTREMADIKAAAEKEAQPWKDAIKKYELQLKEYVQAHRDELSGKRRELTFGVVGFRKSTKLILPKVLDNVITALKKRGMIDCIVSKETVNKDILKTYDSEVVLEVGGTLKSEDAFWYETKREKLPD